MTAYWQNLIEQASQSSKANMNDNDLQIMPLSQLSIIEVAGEDSSRFLQSLLTNDVTALSIGEGQYTGLCNPKGRLIAYFLLLRRDETCFQLLVPNSVAESLQKRLTMYVLRSKATITNRSQELACLGLFPGTNNSVTGLELPNRALKGQTLDNLFAIRLPGDMPRYLAVMPVSSLETFIESQTDYHLCDVDYWELSDIKAGIAKVIDVTQEKFTPQQVNLDLNNSVSFSKGCYAGQEVVARLHYLGKPSRRLFRATTNLASTAEIGSEILTSEGAVAGHIVNSQDDENKRHLLLSLKLAEIEHVLSTQDGSQLKQLELTHTEN